MTLYSIIFKYLIFQRFSHSCWVQSGSELVISGLLECSLLSFLHIYSPSPKPIHTYTNTYKVLIFISWSDFSNGFKKGFSKRGKTNPKTILLFTFFCFNILGRQKLCWPQRTLQLSWKGSFFQIFLLKLLLVICNFAIPFTNCCHGK